MSDTESKESKKFAPGTMGCHEALHMAAVFANAVDKELCDHPAISRNPAWLALAREAEERLAALYEAIGREHLR
jgi:hypothetical protein